jgi:anaphase-promoting complex subunit 1
MDNRSHLQAFRHFWVLATEQRRLVAKDILTGQPVNVPVNITLKTTDPSVDPTLRRTAPCLIPPLDQISRLSTDCGAQFWDISLDFNNTKTRESFASTQSIYLRRRPPREAPFPSTLRALGTDVNAQPSSPLEWLFTLDSLKGTSYPERAAILHNGEEEETDTGRAVDARMEMERGIIDGGDRERLEGARLLFEWGGARDRLLKGGPDVGDSMATERAERGSDDGEPNDAGEWWMRDSVIETLKGRVMVAGREAEG